MNKQELIDKAINEANGLWRSETTFLVVSGGLNTLYPKHTKFNYTPEGVKSDGFWDLVCTKEEFEQRSLELGWINGYKWGVEYPTNGKKPDLPDDIVIEWYSEIEEQWYKSALYLIAFYKSQGACEVINKFRIVDERYKPVRENQEKHLFVSVLSESKPKDENVIVDNSWHERGELPPIGAECEVLNSAIDNAEWEKCVVKFIGDLVCVYTSESCNERCAYLDFIKFRPIKTDREKFIEAAMKFARLADQDNYLAGCFGELYDAGFKAPEIDN